MRTLYESLLDTEKDYDVNDMLIGMLFDKNIQRRRDAFSTLQKMIESYRPKQLTTTAKMKSSDSYFIEFTRPVKIENGEYKGIYDWISYIQICKRKGLSYRTVRINAGDDVWNKRNDKIDDFEMNWNYTRANFVPRASNSILYEVPEELNELFKQIQKEASNHK